MKLIAIDPASYKLGIAVFQDGILIGASTIEATGKDRLDRMSQLIDRLAEAMNFYQPDMVVVEDPMLKGRNNQIMERLKGVIEAVIEIIMGWKYDRKLTDMVCYIAPTTAKKYMGSGSLDKLEVALAAGDMLSTELEKEIMADLIDQEQFDATDAVAIGLTYFLKFKPEELQK